MVTMRLGKARESTVWSSEEFKDSVRRFMESMGYSETTDSYTTGHLPDMIFEPGQSGATRKSWVETKNTKASLSDDEMRESAAKYLLSWIELSPETRFEFWLFVAETANWTRWQKTFGTGRDPSTVTRWLSGIKGDLGGRVASLLSNRPDEVLAFFAEVNLVEGDKQRVEAACKKNEATSTGSIDKYSDRLMREMTARSNVGPVAGVLKSNLFKIRLPPFLSILSVGISSREEARDRLRGVHVPPFAWGKKGEIIVIDVEGLTELFGTLDPAAPVRLSSGDVSRLYPRQVSRLLNSWLARIMFARGALLNNHVFYFPAERSDGVLFDRRIPTPSGRGMTVARVMPVEPGKPPGASSQADDSNVNFVFHKGVSVDAVQEGQDFFAALRTRKVYTSDGRKPLETESARRVDGAFRGQIYDRSESQMFLVSNFGWYIFKSDTWIEKPERWLGAIAVDDQLEVSFDWLPLPIAEGQLGLDQFESDSPQQGVSDAD